jgi:hypothetical protein
MKKKKRNDVILIALLLVLSLAAWAGINYIQGRDTKNAQAVVTIDGEVYGTYPLDQPVTERIELADGSYNVLEIQDGKASVTEASCPDKICVEHHSIEKKNESIVCLPNKVIVAIENGEDTDVDAVAN